MSNSPRYQGFLDPPYNVVLTDDSGAALDLTGCTSTSFTLTMVYQDSLGHAGNAQQCTGVWTVANQATNKGQASYQWTANDMATAGYWMLYTTVKLPAEPGPREFDPELIQILPGTVGTGAAPPGVLPAPIAKALFFNATDYGARGDGSNQGTALQAALSAASAAGGGIVYVAQGAYTISAPLIISSNTTLWLANGAVITLAQNSNCNMLQNTAVQASRRVIDGVTNSTTTFTSATAAFVSGDVGKAIRIYYQDGTYLSTTIASVTNGTTAVLAAAATVSQTGLYAAIGSRDTNIRVIGGTWYRSINNYTGAHNGWESNSLRFRHVDGLEVGNLTANNYAGKYAVNPGDCTNFSIHDITTQYNVSDTVHINGPCSWGAIERITSYGSADDIVSMTCADFRNQQQWMGDCMGNISDIVVEKIITAPAILAGTTRAVLIQAGVSSSSHAFLIDRITVRGVRSQLSNYAVYLGQDTQDSFTTGGTWGRILIDDGINTSTAPPGGFVRVANGTTATAVEVRSVFDVGATTYVWIETGSTVTRLVCVGIAVSFVSLQGTVTTADIIDLPASLTANQTLSGNNIFTGTTTVHDITVVPNSGVSTSASVFLDNQGTPDQIWEFFCDAAGSFGVYDHKNNNQIMKLDSGAVANAFEIDNGSIYLRATTRLSSPFALSSAFQGNRTSVTGTGNYNANANGDYFIGCNALTGAKTITLPNLNYAGQIFIIKDEGGQAGANNITIQGSGGQTVDGGTKTINANYGVVRVYSTGAGWATW